MEALPDALVSSLKEAAAYPDDPSANAGIRCIQTHISWLFMTRDRVYKLRKAVELPFVSFAERSARNTDCLREVELNRRLAPDVYLGIAPLIPARESEGVSWTAGPVGEGIEASADALEHCVVMRRLPDGRDAQTLLETNRLEPIQLERTAERLVDFHSRASLGTPAPYDREEWLNHVFAPVADALALAADHPCEGVDEMLPRRLQERCRRRFDSLRDALDRRRERGRVVDGHGDLQLAHLWFDDEEGPPKIIDCVEFRDDLRHSDVAAEIAFLAMDLRYRGRRDLSEHFLFSYAMASDDFDLYRVVDFFIAHRANIRGAVAAVAACDRSIENAQRQAAAHSAQAHLELAESALANQAPGLAIAVCGMVGSGKSTVARHLAGQSGGVVLASDRLRKALAGLSTLERGHHHPELGLYDSAFSERVYGGLLERAAPLIASGRPVILDATYASAAQRDGLAQWAKAHDWSVLLVAVRCGEEESLKRLRRREQQGQDPSDAGPEFYATSKARFEPPSEWPESARIIVRTDAPDWRDDIAAKLAGWVAVRG